MDDHAHAHLLLGRLDGRLHASPAADLWLARARLKGAVCLAQLAGIPIREDDLMGWICGHSPPPRRSEGLNDPLSVAALFHFALLAGEVPGDPVAEASLRTLRSMLDDRAEAQLHAEQDLVWFGPAFAEATRMLLAPLPSSGFGALAERLIEVHRRLGQSAGEGRSVHTADVRRLDVEPRTFDTVWILGTLLARAHVSAGLTLRPLPTLVGLPRFLPDTPCVLAEGLCSRARDAAVSGLAELDRLERALEALAGDIKVTRRSKAPLLARLQLAYPGLRPPAIARLLGISPQGAAKLQDRLASLQREGGASRI